MLPFVSFTLLPMAKKKEKIPTTNTCIRCPLMGERLLYWIKGISTMKSTSMTQLLTLFLIFLESIRFLHLLCTIEMEPKLWIWRPLTSANSLLLGTSFQSHLPSRQMTALPTCLGWCTSLLTLILRVLIRWCNTCILVRRPRRSISLLVEAWIVRIDWHNLAL